METTYKETKYLTFVHLGYSPSGKTSIFYVKNKRQDILGIVHWETSFRKYGYHSFDGFVYDNKCLQDITEFLEEITAEHKAEKEKGENK